MGVRGLGARLIVATLVAAAAAAVQPGLAWAAGITIGDAFVVEGGGGTTLTFEVTIDAVQGTDTMVDYATSDGTAIAPR